MIGGTSLIGGKGGILGSILGAILMAEVQNGINIMDIPVVFMKPILGVLIVSAVVMDQWQKERYREYKLCNIQVFLRQCSRFHKG